MTRSNEEQKRLDEDERREKELDTLGAVPVRSRQWGTVREDYSANGDAWDYFPHEHARSRAYRWGEDGLLGITDRECRLSFALALWNGNDPILKERLFGLSGPEGNHGEDVKELYYYLDATPTSSYLKALYKYPHAAFPYAELVKENARRRQDRTQGEYEIEDTGVFAQSRYFDITVEYAKAGPADILIRITCANRGPDAAPLHLLPTLWQRNTWVWGGMAKAIGQRGASVSPAPTCCSPSILHSIAIISRAKARRLSSSPTTRPMPRSSSARRTRACSSKTRSITES